MIINGYIDIKDNVVLQARDKDGNPVTGTVSRPLSQDEIKKIQKGIQSVILDVILADPATKDAVKDLLIQGEINIRNNKPCV